MTTSDLVAVAAISSTLQILQDFTNDKDKIGARQGLCRRFGQFGHGIARRQPGLFAGKVLRCQCLHLLWGQRLFQQV